MPEECNRNSVEATLRIPFPNSLEAGIACKVLSVDREPRRNFVEKSLTVDGAYLQTHFKADQMPEHTPAPTRHRAIYGFSFYLFFFILFIFYVVWALLPEHFSKNFPQLKYLPDKYFAISLPMVVLCSMFLFIFFIYPAINLSMTSSVDDLSTVIDAKVALHSKWDNEIKDCFWEKIANERSVPLVSSDAPNNPKKINCESCSEQHNYPPGSSGIPPLRFIDLSEMNKNYFD